MVNQLLDHKLYSADVVKKEIMDKTVQIKFTVPSFEANEDKSYGIVKSDYSTVKVKGLENTKEVSRPALPYYSFIVQGAPGDFKVKLNKGKTFTIKDFNPSPARELPCRCAKDKGINPNINVFKYEEGRGLYSVEYLGDFRGKHLSKVTVSPMKYRDQKFEVYPELEFSLTRVKGGGINFELSELGKEAKTNKNYLMVAASHLMSASKKLADYKRVI